MKKLKQSNSMQLKRIMICVINCTNFREILFLMIFKSHYCDCFNQLPSFNSNICDKACADDPNKTCGSSTSTTPWSIYIINASMFLSLIKVA